jgi:hypothetical protein
MALEFEPHTLGLAPIWLALLATTEPSVSRSWTRVSEHPFTYTARGPCALTRFVGSSPAALPGLTRVGRPARHDRAGASRIEFDPGGLVAASPD